MPFALLDMREGLPLLRVWVHGRSRAGGQEDQKSRSAEGEKGRRGEGEKGRRDTGTRGTPCPIFAACLIPPTCATCAPSAPLSMLVSVPFRHSPGSLAPQGFAGLLALLDFAQREA